MTLVSTQNIDFGFDHTELTFEISNGGSGKLDWTIRKDNLDWLKVFPESGENDAVVTLSLPKDRKELPDPRNKGALTIISEEGGEKTINISASRNFITEILPHKRFSLSKFRIILNQTIGTDKNLAWSYRYSFFNIPVFENYCWFKVNTSYNSIPDEGNVYLKISMTAGDEKPGKLHFSAVYKSVFFKEERLLIFSEDDLPNDKPKEKWKIIRYRILQTSGDVPDNVPGTLLEAEDTKYGAASYSTNLGIASITGVEEGEDLGKTGINIKFSFYQEVTIQEYEVISTF